MPPESEPGSPKPFIDPFENTQRPRQPSFEAGQPSKAEPTSGETEQSAARPGRNRPDLLQPRELLTARRAGLAASAAAGNRAEPLSGEVIPPGTRRAYAGTPPQSPAELLRNPYVLAALAVAGAVVLAILVVFFFGGGPTGAGFDPPAGGVSASGTPQPRGVIARSIASATVREGPSLEYQDMGVLRANQDVEVTGKNSEEATWFQIAFPRNSQLRGWVPATALRVPENAIAGLPIALATPIARPTVVIPTPPPQPTATQPPVATATATPEPAGVDLAVSVVPSSCIAGSPLVLTIRNATGEAVSGRSIQVLVATPSEILGSVSATLDLPAGGSTTLSTGIAVRAPRTTATVDLVGAPSDPNSANNHADCLLQIPVTPTSVPIATPTPVQPTATPAGTVVVPPPIASPTPTPVQ